MCRFSNKWFWEGISIELFQYILCVGLALLREQQRCHGHISIHLMCRFSYSFPADEPYAAELFQYILCVGLASFLNLIDLIVCNFNTSYV